MIRIFPLIALTVLLLCKATFAETIPTSRVIHIIANGKTEIFNNSKLDTKKPLEVASVTVKSGDSVSKILKKHGITASTDAYTLMHDCNPKLKKIQAIRIGQVLKIPKVTHYTGLSTKVPHRIKLDPELRLQINIKKRKISKLIESFMDLNSYKKENVYVEGTKLLKRINQSLDFFFKKPKNYSHIFLKQVDKMMKQTIKLIDDLNEYRTKLDRTTLKKIKLIASDFSIKENTLKKQSRDSVNVNLNLKSSNEKIPQIFFVPKSLFDDTADHSIRADIKLSPSQISIPAGEYYFWAVRESQDDLGTLLKSLISEIQFITITPGTKKITLDVSFSNLSK